MKKIKFTNEIEYFPSKIIGIGRNYAEHIKEMQSPHPAKPVFFIKPNSSICDINEPLAIPLDAGDVHHEIELAVCIKKESSKVEESAAMKFVGGYGLALDLTLRDVQAAAKKKGLPWALAKGFDNACPLSGFVPGEEISNPHNLDINLKINGKLKQSANTELMLFKIPQLISYISNWITLLPGDIILTGTPSGVGPLHSGDKIEAAIERIGLFTTHVK